MQDEFGVSLVYAWHSLHGYWAGVSAESPSMPYDVRIVTPTLTPGAPYCSMCVRTPHPFAPSTGGFSCAGTAIIKMVDPALILWKSMR